MRYPTTVEIASTALAELTHPALPLHPAHLLNDDVVACDCHTVCWHVDDVLYVDTDDACVIQCPIPDEYAATTNR